jgi:hypothetical protein
MFYFRIIEHSSLKKKKIFTMLFVVCILFSQQKIKGTIVIFPTSQSQMGANHNLKQNLGYNQLI